MYLTVLMDVEDLIAPVSDDFTGMVAEMLYEEGVIATFCIVGEKARLLKARGKTRAIAALKQHDIAFHTDFHSVHPTISEYLAVRDWEEGVEEALRRETPGVQAIQDVFGVSPSCLGGPGNTWGPAVCEAMRQLDVPAFVYAHTRIPEGGVHRFDGLLAYPNDRGLPDVHYHDDALARQDLESLKAGLQADREAGLFWQQSFIGHPTRILHERFWDDPNFVNGANPPRSEWKPAPRKSPQDLDRALTNFRQAARTIRTWPGIELKTIRQMNEILSTAPSTSLSFEEQAQVWPEIERNLLSMAHWPIVPRDIDYSSICRQTQQLLPTLERFDVASLQQ